LIPQEGGQVPEDLRVAFFRAQPYFLAMRLGALVALIVAAARLSI
jgi:hypothetical protein